MIREFIQALIVVILRLIASFTEAAFNKASKQESEDLPNDKARNTGHD